MPVLLYLVRHGVTPSNAAARFLGWCNEALTAQGVRQAEEIRESLVGVTFQSRWTSDLRRAVQTAGIIGGSFRQDRRLREIDLGSLEGKSWDEIEPSLQQRLIDFDDFCAPGGESVIQLRGRVNDFLDDLTEGSHLIVTHGGVIRTLLRQVSADERIPPGSTRTIDWTDRSVYRRPIIGP